MQTEKIRINREKKAEEEQIKEVVIEEIPEAVAEAKEDRKIKEDLIPGIAYVFGSSNNTIVHITDLSGNTVARISGGMVTKQSRLKANPTTAMFVAKRAAEVAKDTGINALYIRMRGKTGAPGMGPGTHAAVKTLGKENFRILGILDTTRMPRGGPKAGGGKRGRRV